MISRRSAATAFGASLELVAVSLGAWLSSGGKGVGTDLEQMTLATSSVVGGSGVPGEQHPGGSSLNTQTSTVSRFADVPLVDATRIEAPDEVQPPRSVRISSVDIVMPVSATGVTVVIAYPVT